MKTNLLLTVCFSMMVFTASAQDTLRVNFKPADTPGDFLWDSILVTDKAAYEGGYSNFNIFGETVAVLPTWLNSPVPENVRAVDRDNGRYTGGMAKILRSYIAVDSRYENDCDILNIEISGLPAGTYTFQSYHHDFNDQFGSFTVTTSVNFDNKDVVLDNQMISHSLDLESFESTYGELDDMVATEYDAHYVVNSVDSVTKYIFDKIVVSSQGDVVNVNFKNVLAPNPEMGHNQKFVLINGFKLYESAVSGIENNQFAQQNVKIINNKAGNVFITGERISEVVLYSIDGMLIERIDHVDDRVELTNLQQGVYIANVDFKDGSTICRKIIVH